MLRSYTRKPQTIQAIQYDGTKEMAKKIEEESTSAFFDDEVYDGVWLFADLYEGATTAVPVYKGDYLIYVGDYELMRQSEFERKFE